MRSVWLRTLLAAWFLGGVAVAAEAPRSEQAPKPREWKAPNPILTIPMGNYRTNPYDVWQYYGVDQTGAWKPRVVNGPYGYRYVYNLEPYPWAAEHQKSFMPMIQGTPYRTRPAWNLDYMPYCGDE